MIPGRVTYAIDREDAVRHVFNSMTNIGQHVGDTLEVVRPKRAPEMVFRGLLPVICGKTVNKLVDNL